MSQEEAARRFAASSRAEASTPEKTAESIGERVEDAYSDPESVARHSARKVGQPIAARGDSHKGFGSNRLLSARVVTAKAVSRQFDQERF
jgi:hypothetical protein